MKATEKLRYLIDVPTTGLYTISVQGTNGNPDAAFRFNVDGQPVSGLLTIPNTGSNWVVGTVTAGGILLQAGTRTLEIEVLSDGGGFAGNFDKILISRAYDGTPFAIPGSFQAEHFDHGGEGVAYHDTTPGNASIYPSNLRQDTDVDLTACPANTQCGVIVGYVKAGEWLEYEVNAATAGTYAIEVQGTNGNPSGAFHIEIDPDESGEIVLGSLAVPNTGSNWVVGTVTTGTFSLSAGTHTVRIVMDSDAGSWVGNFDLLRFIQP